MFPYLVLVMLALGGCLANQPLPHIAVASVGQWPNDVVFDPDSARLFVADEGSATVTVLGSAGEPIGTIRLVTRARHLAVDSTLGHLYAPNEGSGYVAALDTRTLEERFRVNVGKWPHGITVDPATHRVFVGIEGEDAVVGFDGRTGRRLFAEPVRSGPGGIASDPATGRVFVVSVKTDRVTVLDGTTGHPLGDLPVGGGPTHIRVNGRTGVVVVLNTEANSVTLLDGRGMRHLATLAVGEYPIGLAVHEDADRIYIVNNRGNTLSVVDRATRMVLKQTPIPANVSSVALNAQQGILYLALKSDAHVILLRVRNVAEE